MEPHVPEELVEHIARATGLDKDVVLRVLREERRYYMAEIYEVHSRPGESEPRL